MSELITSGAGDEQQKPVPAQDPGDSDRRHGPQPETSPGKRRPSGRILDDDDCRRGLSQLPGLLLLGLVKPQQANAMRGVYHELREFSRLSAKQGACGNGLPSDLLEIVRRDRRLSNMFEGILSEEQIAILMNDAKEDDHGET